VQRVQLVQTAQAVILVSKEQLVQVDLLVSKVSEEQLVQTVAKVSREQLDWLGQVVQDLTVQQPLQYQVSLDSIIVYLMILDIMHGAG
jgi:hypothetical protein